MVSCQMRLYRIEQLAVRVVLEQWSTRYVNVPGIVNRAIPRPPSVQEMLGGLLRR